MAALDEGVMQLDFTPEEEAFRGEVRAFLRSRLPDDWVGITGGETALELSAEICRELAERGWLARSWPEEWGGAGASIWESLILEEELTGNYEPRGGQYIGTDRVGPCLMAFGTDEQKRRFLPPILAGEAVWAQLFSEREAGSDLASLTTRAVWDGADYVVEGEKVWTSYANSATDALLLARTKEGSQGREGITAFLVDMDSAGIDVREIPSPLGWHRIHSVLLEGVRVSPDRVLGKVDRGWEITRAFLDLERAGTARYARAYRVLEMVESVGDVDDALTRSRLAANLAYGRIVEVAVSAAYAMHERGELPRWVASAVRVLNGLYEQSVADFALDELGATARVAGPDAQAAFGGRLESFCVRQAPTGTTTGGSYEIQMTLVAREALGLGKPAA
jgi:alkylation response protein AidB-like acyl-CoA dehydrogenase